MTITTDLLEIDIVLFHYVSFEWWYEAREYIPSKDQKLSRFRSSANQCWKEEEEKSDGGDEEVEDGDEEHESTLVYKIEMILRDVGKIKSICSTFTSPCHPYSINLN
ncbi:hypothetical protein V1477_001446 [Vespula maculifrons]|uniref:Uncharacterized protein n=1 Tax=Vespula maculifrons TaxID=7453 RepID=A0ABD2CYX6_VESMC